MKTDAKHTPEPLAEHYKSFRDLPGGIVNHLQPPRFETLLTGVDYARQDRSGKITVTYSDGTTESAACPDYELMEMDSFKVCSVVQNRARAAIAEAERDTPHD